MSEGDPAPVYAHVKFKVSGNMRDPNYHVKDGDAAYLDAGAPVYSIIGHATGGELAAPFYGRIVLYQAAAAAT